MPSRSTAAATHSLHCRSELRPYKRRHVSSVLAQGAVHGTEAQQPWPFCCPRSDYNPGTVENHGASKKGEHAHKVMYMTS